MLLFLHTPITNYIYTFVFWLCKGCIVLCSLGHQENREFQTYRDITLQWHFQFTLVFWRLSSVIRVMTMEYTFTAKDLFTGKFCIAASYSNPQHCRLSCIYSSGTHYLLYLLTEKFIYLVRGRAWRILVVEPRFPDKVNSEDACERDRNWNSIDRTSISMASSIDIK